MCTAVTYTTKDHYFGRTFDWEVSYGEQIAFLPRNYPLYFRKQPVVKHHYGLLGMAVVVEDDSHDVTSEGKGNAGAVQKGEVSAACDGTVDGGAENYPLYYDAINEKGLGMAGLNFPDNTDYKEPVEGKDNIAPFELIPWILGQCETVKDAKCLLDRMNLVKIPFSEQYPLSPLHWIIADKKEAITVECVKEGLKVYDNPVGVLTNNPPFDMHMFYLTNFIQLSKAEPENMFAGDLQLKPYSRGMGAMGLPGDWSSASRFVRCAFVKKNSCSGSSESESVSQFFRILGSVEQIRGCVELEQRESGEGIYEISVYTSCCNLDKGLYYYKTYENSSVSCIDMYREDLEGNQLSVYPLKRELQVHCQNEKKQF